VRQRDRGTDRRQTGRRTERRKIGVCVRKRVDVCEKEIDGQTERQGERQEKS
jgi:hypothetical protein